MNNGASGLTQFLPFWLGGLCLAAIMVGNWFLLHRMMAVSGRVTALINLFRRSKEDQAAIEEANAMSEADLVEALRLATEAAMADPSMTPPMPGAISQPPASAASTAGSVAMPPESSREELPREREPLPPVTLATHATFFLGLAAGGALAMAIRSIVFGTAWQPTLMRAHDFFTVYGRGPTAVIALLFGGLLVGAGTRMSGGCSSGHGLCGFSRLQPGSILATAGFFGTAILVATLLRSGLVPGATP